MKDSFKDYTKTIIKDFLKLQRGEALSVNAEESNLEEAKYLANEAINITGANVKIVTTVKGKPQEVIEFDAPDQLTTKVTGLAMVRLVNDNTEFSDNPDDISKDNLPLVQKLGHLAEPLEIGRRIAVPWCIANVNDKAPENSIDKLAEEVRYRQSYMRHWDIHTMHFKGNDVDFTVDVPEDVYFVGGLQTLSSGRTFLYGKDFDNLSFTVDKNSLNGTFKADVKVAGNDKKIDFVFENGKMVSHTTDVMLDKILTLDEDISKVGLISLRDKQAVVCLGGSDTKSLAQVPESEEELPEEFNTSLFTVKCNLPQDINVEITDCEGKTRELIRKGYFVE